MVAYVRTVKTASGATAVQIVWSTRRGSRQIEHLGSAHDGGEVEALKAAARQRLAQGQGALDLGLNTAGADGEPLEIVASKSSHLWEALCQAYRVLGFDKASGGDEVFRDLVLARIIEPTSKIDSLRVLCETGVEPVDYRTVTRHLPTFAKQLCATHYRKLAPLMLVWGQPVWCFTTSAPSTSKPMPQTGSVSRGSLRRGAWNRRSPSDCSPTPRGSRWRWKLSKATKPRPRPCCR